MKFKSLNNAAQEVPCQKTGMYQIFFEGFVNAATSENNTLLLWLGVQG